MIPSFQQGQFGRWVARAGGDPYRANRLLLMHCEGSDGGTSFVDSSAYARTLTVNGSVTTSTDQASAGSTSAKYPNTASTYISVSSPEDFARGSGDFTVEFSIWIVAAAATREYIMRKKASGTTQGFALLLQILGGTTEPNMTLSTGGVQFGVRGFGSLGTGAWKKCCYERYGNLYTVWVDGTRVSNFTDSSNSMSSATGAFEIGSSETFSDTKPNYYLDEIRISDIAALQGAASYTVQSGAFPDA